MSDFLCNFIVDEIGTKRPVVNTAAPVRSPAGRVETKYKKDDSVKIIFRTRGAQDEEITIPRFTRSKNNLINKSIILYGPSGSGKSTIIRDFMHEVRKAFPLVMGFVPTNAEKHDYDAMIPRPFVHEEFGLKEIKEVYTRQKTMTEIYNNANNIKTLNKLFERVANRRAQMFLDKMKHLRDKALRESDQGTLSEKSQRRTEIEDIFKERLARFYKQIINPNAKRLERMDLDQEEKFAIKYRHLNPRILIVFDDAFIEVMKLIKEGRRKDDEVIKNFFFKGRWANITHWYGFQDDNRLDSDIRKNAFVNVFTDKQVALSYFNRPANSFSALERKRAEAIINTIFDESKMPKHAKLVYMRLDKNRFYYHIADEYEDRDVQMCSHVARKMAKEMESKDSNFDTSNPYFARFADQV